MLLILFGGLFNSSYAGSPIVLKPFERFGERFPQEPNPGNYPELMDRFIQQIPSLVKARTLGIQKSIMEEGL